MKNNYKLLLLGIIFLISCDSKPTKTEMTKDDYILCFCQYIKATDGNGKIYDGYYHVDYVMEEILAKHGYLPVAFPNFEAKSYWDKDVCNAKTKIVNEFGKNCLECSKVKPLADYLVSNSCEDANIKMTDEDFIKIQVRFETQLPFESSTLPSEIGDYADEQLNRIKSLCKKYGYSIEDYAVKKRQVTMVFEKLWIQKNIQIICGAQGISRVSSDDDWEEFFIEYEKYLSKLN